MPTLTPLLGSDTFLIRFYIEKMLYYPKDGLRGLIIRTLPEDLSTQGTLMHWAYMGPPDPPREECSGIGATTC